MAAPNAVIPMLYNDLNGVIKSSEWEKVLTFSNKILQESPDEMKAFQCKTVALIHLSKFDDCLHHLSKARGRPGFEQRFERAYCEYRLNRLTEALATLEGCESHRDQELRAQILYRLERYADSLALYRGLVRDCADDYVAEREANLAAAFAARAMFSAEAQENAHHTTDSLKQLSRDTYEQVYNTACALIGLGRLPEAADVLAKAERICREELADSDPDTLTEELAPILFQQAYLDQVSGSQQTEWRKVYQSIANAKLADSALMAVCANNLVCANKDQNLFDSKKRIKLATGDALKQKLSQRQRSAIAVNQCLVYLHSNQGDLCKRSAESLLQQQSAAVPCHHWEEAALAMASQLAKERPAGSSKPGAQAVEFLESLLARVEDSGDPGRSTVRIRLALVQLLSQSGSPRRAFEALKGLPDDQLFGSDRLVSAAMRLCALSEDRQAAGQLLEEAVAHYRGRQGEGPESADRLRVLLRMAARFAQSCGDHRRAAHLFNELLGVCRPGDKQRVIASLVHAYAQFDPPKAEETSRMLKDSPALSKASSPSQTVDSESGDQLESSFAFGSKYSSKRAAPASPGAAVGKKGARSPGMQPQQQQQQPAAPQPPPAASQQQKKSRKAKRLPKNYDPAGPAPDPERWLPRRERSSYRPRKKEKHRMMTRGPQGATSSAGDLDVRASAEASSGVSPAAATEAPKPPLQPPQQQQQKKKKPSNRRW